MLTMLASMTIIMIIAMITMTIKSILSKKTLMDREKKSPFECGFDLINSTWIPFSIQFFLIFFLISIYYFL